MSEWVIGVLGGSGLYEVDGLEKPEWVSVETPWGDPSDEILVGRIHGVRFAFLPRHGRGHRLPPAAINARANIDALKRLGCTDLLSVSAVGSLRRELEPGRFVIVDQFIDQTRSRGTSFFGPGLVAHVSMADPVCLRLSVLAAAAAEAAGANVTEGSTYLAIDGPQLSTRAESRLYHSSACDVIGMTAMPEAKLAREAELPYALVGMVTDYDCWHEEEEPVQVATVIAQLKANAITATRMIEALAKGLPTERSPCPLDTVLDNAIVTAPDARDPALMAKLDAVAGRWIRNQS